MFQGVIEMGVLLDPLVAEEKKPPRNHSESEEPRRLRDHYVPVNLAV